MSSKKRCIFHVPNYIEPSMKSGSSLRPLKLLNALKTIGYRVDLVMGYGEERKEQISLIKANIRAGIKYDFLYSESSTMPTLLTEKNHFPKYPFLDFGFLNFCRENGISIGLFYRDIHWRFPHYKNNVSLSKRVVTRPMYYYDLLKYKKLLDVLYLPGRRMEEHIPIKNIGGTVKYLPPGCDIKAEFLKRKALSLKETKENEPLKLFYVGGIGDLYKLDKLLKVVGNMDKVKLTLCCRKGEWDANYENLKKYLGDNITIVHEYGPELEKYYLEADIVSLFLEPIEYMALAMPIKLFEYISHGIPVIAVNGTEAGAFVEKEGIGWTISYEEESLRNLLENILKNRSVIIEKHKKVIEALRDNTWEERARTIEKNLTR